MDLECEETLNMPGKQSETLNDISCAALIAKIDQLEQDLQKERNNSKQLRIRAKRLEKELNKLKSGIKKFLDDDQIHAMQRKKKKEIGKTLR